MLIGVSIVSVVLVVALVVTGFVLAAKVASTPAETAADPLAVPAAPTPGEDGTWCRTLTKDLPDELASLPRRTVIGDPPGVAAWGAPALILRCGLVDPAELTCSAALTQFTGAHGTSVAWLRLADSSAVTFIAVDRPVRVAVTLPPDTGVGPIQQLSDVVGEALPQRPVCTDGVVNPVDNS